MNKYTNLNAEEAAQLLVSKTNMTAYGLASEVLEGYPERLNDVIALVEHLKTFVGADRDRGPRTFRTSLNEDEKKVLAS